MLTSPRNPRVVAARKLAQRKHRQEQGRFAVEGLQLLGMALAAGYRPQDVFYCADLFAGETAPRLLQQFEQANAHLIEASADVLASLSDRDTSQGLFATFALPDHQLEDVQLHCQLVLVLDRLRDPGNAGTLIRTADAVGADAVILIAPGVDVYDPRTIRASMGSLFNLPVVAGDSVPDLFAWLQEHHLRAVGADAARGMMWTDFDWRGGLALVLGNEAQGLSDDLALAIADWVALPILGQADSLNVAVAGGVLLYAWVAANQPPR